MFKCKGPEMKAYKEKLYEHICACSKEQDTQQTLIKLITKILFNQPIIIMQEYENYGWSTKCNLEKLTRL